MGPRICISNKFPGAAAGLGPHFENYCVLEVVNAIKEKNIEQFKIQW